MLDKAYHQIMESLPETLPWKMVVGIVGPPGCGKSQILEFIRDYNPDWDFFDDPSANRVIKKQLRRFLKGTYGGVGFVADCYFCEPEIREKAEAFMRLWCPTVTIQWAFFENAPEKCRRNVVYRADGREVEGSIARFAKSYVIPEGAIVLPVWQPFK